MKRVILTALAGAVALAAATPGQAADLPRKVLPGAPVVAAFSWSGFYVGINGGYGWGTSNVSNTVVGSGSISPKGGLFGATGGYNMQTGVWVWGFEGDIDYSTVRATDATALLCALGCEVKNTWLGTARGRIGYAFDRWMTYFTGGIAFGDIKVSNGVGSITKTQTGWTLGGGAEWAWGGPWSAKFEYLYVDLGSATCDATTCLVTTTANFKENILRAGLNYRF